MIIKHQQFDLLGKKILERAIFQAPVREARTLSDEACFLYNVQDQFEIYSSLEKVSLHTHQGIVMRCGNYLANHIKISDLPSEAIAVHFHPEVLADIYKKGFPEALIKATNSTRNNLQVAQVEIDRVLENYIESLLFYFDNTALINDELIILKLKELIMLLINADSIYSRQVKSILQNLFHPYDAAFKEVIQAHLYDSLTLQELAALTSLSLSSFKRKFKSIFNETPASYFRQQRLKRASELLKNSKMRVKGICYESGFNDVTSFTKLFTTHFGSSPTRSREQNH